MKRALIFASIWSLLLVSHSYGEDQPLSGSVFLGGQAVNLDHQSAKFNEYNALGPGVVGGGNASYDTGKYHLDTNGSYLGEDDMYLKVNGGKWGDFKYSLFYTEFPHNYSFENRSVFTNPGSQNMTLSPGASYNSLKNSDGWPSTSFDNKITRKDVGGSLDVTAVRPFFFTVDANRLQRQGQMPFGAVDALSGPGTTGTGGAFTNRAVDLSAPIDDHTTNANALFGWKNKEFYAAFGGGFSQYSNQAEFTRFQEPFFNPTGPAPATPATGSIVGPPDNRSWDMRFTGTAKLPCSSTFALNADYQRNTSQTTLLNTIETGTQAAPTLALLRLSRPTFNGDVEYWNVGANLTSNPMKDMTTKLYFKYLDRKDNSDYVTFTNPSSASSSPVTNSLFSYDKTSVGGEATYRFMKNLKGILGYDFTDTRREVNNLVANADSLINNIPDTWAQTFTAQLVYNPLDWLGTRLKYQKIYQDTHFELQPGTAAATVIENNIRRFDIGNKTQDMVKLTTDISPLETLGMSFEYAYKLDNYQKNALGFQQEEENEFILDANYLWKGMKFFAFFDYDVSSTTQTQRQGSGGGGNPASAPSPTGFNWNADLQNNNYAYGVGTSFPIVKDRLAFVVQYDFEKNNGTANFTSQTFTAAQTGLGVNNGNIDIGPWDDYTRQDISARVVFDYNKSLGFVFGYIYSQFRLNDGQLNGYQYVYPFSAANGNTYLSGAYTDQSYKANVYY
ncbi:MAG: MtrB/PioB family outer membrane beta-barrel protein, partial [Syntrophorhabdales bacterium]